MLHCGAVSAFIPLFLRDGHLGCSWCFGNTNNSIMNYLVHVLFWACEDVSEVIEVWFQRVMHVLFS